MNAPIPVARPHAFSPHAMVTAHVSRRFARRSPPRGFTLVEMLVALAITLIMMGAVVTLFGVITESVAGSRSALELSDRLRAARNRLQLDLQGATATMQPPLRPENDEGYFEIIEGAVNDNGPYVSDPSWSLLGDIDDVLMFTTRSRGAPFSGKLNGAVITSPVAEVVYFLAQDRQIDAAGNVVNSPPPVIDATTDPATRLFTLYRRVLLVAPAVGASTTFNDHFYDENDISIRYETPGGTPTLFPNTLGDLTKRENRFAHYGNDAWMNGALTISAVNYGTFPFPVDLRALPRIPLKWPPEFPGEPAHQPAAMPTPWPNGPPRRPVENAFLAPMVDFRVGDDVLLNNVLAFDVQVFDPNAPVFVDDVAIEPRDPGWQSKATAWRTAGYPSLPMASAPAGLGAYVDLGYGVAPALSPPKALLFGAAPQGNSGLTAPPYVFDTWSLHYENDGQMQNGNGPDFGTNGLDDGGTAGVVDDIGEYDTLPPYPAPLRGVRVTIRVYEPDSQVVREAVVVQDFLPD